MRALVALIAASLLSARLAGAEEPDAQTQACIAHNENAQLALRRGDAISAKEHARACNIPACAELLRNDCSELLRSAEARLRPWEIRTAPVRPPERPERPPPSKRSAPKPRRLPAPVESDARSALPSLVLGGIALTGFAGFAVFGLRGRARERALACSPRCDEAEVSAVSREYLMADLSLGAGVLALAASAYFYPWGREKPVQASVGGRRVSVGMSF